MARADLGWFGIFRLGLVQTSLGAIVVLTTSTMNRVMVVEHLLPAMLPGALVALHYLIQLSRPRLGHASDLTGRRTPLIRLGMLVLAIGGVLAAVATAIMGQERWFGTTLAVIAFSLIGLGVGASGTSLLALLASLVPDHRRAAAGSMVWIMMILGFVLTAGIAGQFLDPFSGTRLVLVTATVAGIALLTTMLATAGIEAPMATPRRQPTATAPALPFRAVLGEIWDEARARQFTIFVFVSMLAYSTQDLLLEPFAGTVFGLTPGESTQQAGLQNAGVLLGMLLVAALGTLFARSALGSLKLWTVTGCVGSALALVNLTLAGISGPPWPLQASVFVLGVANGCFAVAAIATMMALAGQGQRGREGVRMGLWGAAQAIAFAIGGFLGTALLDLLRALALAPAHAYACIFLIEAVIFLAAAALAARIVHPNRTGSAEPDTDSAVVDVKTALAANNRWRLTS
ncbi:MAG: BCD family MFS transporter [Pseudomonadota bacterium]